MKLYLKYFSMHLKSVMQYKTSFFLTVLGQFLVSFSLLIGIFFMFARFNNIQGFTYDEVLLCFSIVLMSFSIAECFVRGFDSFYSIISNGEFDRIMVRPKNEVFQVLATKIDFSRLGRFLQALITMIYSISISQIIWTGDKIFTFVFMIVGGIILFSGLFIIYAAICFFTIEGLEFMNIFTDGSREFGQYPIAIYGEGILKFLTYIIPLACVQYYPLLYLLGKSNNIFYMYTPLSAFFFLIPCYLLWKFGIKHYKSTGS